MDQIARMRWLRSVLVTLTLVAGLVVAPAPSVRAAQSSPALPGYDCKQLPPTPTPRAYNYDSASDLAEIAADFSVLQEESLEELLDYEKYEAGTKEHLLARWKRYTLNRGALNWDQYRAKYVDVRDHKLKGAAFENYFLQEEALDLKTWNKGKKIPGGKIVDAKKDRRPDFFHLKLLLAYELKSGPGIDDDQLADYVRAIEQRKVKQLVYVFGEKPEDIELQKLEKANGKLEEFFRAKGEKPLIPLIVARCWPATSVPRPASTRGTSGGGTSSNDPLSSSTSSTAPGVSSTTQPTRPPPTSPSPPNAGGAATPSTDGQASTGNDSGAT
ncbi:MAG: hypothetical protein LC808_40465, partial [Actinobacteria bacterium]|nr:hypothetical protein [Actinomycetota bacterium]